MNLLSAILASITLLIQNYADYDKAEDYKKTLLGIQSDLNLPRIAIYDFIIVGGGTAGSVVASRLSEKFNVLLLETGGNPVPATDNQFLGSYVSVHPAINTAYPSVPQKYFTQETGGLVSTVMGRMLGGCGSHNANTHNRGSPYDYDNFAAITGDDSWSYKNMLKHFKNYERLVGELINENEREEFYGTRGPLTVETKLHYPINTAWFQAARELGYGVHDPNGNQTEGFAPVVLSMVHGERQSTYTAFVKPFRNLRKALTGLPYSEVEQVLINADKNAYGVLYRRHGIIQIAHASKEVIVSGGVIASPLLLMRSGIGPREVLQEANIPVLSDLEGVGKNFRNHMATPLPFEAVSPDPSLLPKVDDKDVEAELMKFQEAKRGGIFSETNKAQAFIVSSRAKAEGERNWPDIHLVFTQLPGIDQKMNVNAAATRLKSAGSVGLNTTAYRNGYRDDLSLALIDHNHYSDPSDMDVVIEGIRLILNIMENTTSFREIGAKLTGTIPEQCRSLEFRSYEYCQCFLKQRSRFKEHYVGTCSMGRDNDPMAVVDSKLRVRGVGRLRIIDSSVLPRTPNANTNAAAIVVAEKASQDIIDSIVV